LPVFQGGAQRARLGRAQEELQGATLQRNAAQLRVEERVRSVLHQTGASFVGIELAADAAEAAHRNLDLVRERYAEGIADILVLLDAQNQALGADLAAANAIFDYLTDLVGAQRAAGRFDYFRSSEDRQDFLNRLDEYVRSAGYEPRKP
ncbi:MAG: TolC family protein, partial [bacterium]|nr:TolC family protein [bacterium]